MFVSLVDWVLICLQNVHIWTTTKLNWLSAKRRGEYLYREIPNTKVQGTVTAKNVVFSKIILSHNQTKLDIQKVFEERECDPRQRWREITSYIFQSLLMFVTSQNLWLKWFWLVSFSHFTYFPDYLNISLGGLQLMDMSSQFFILLQPVKLHVLPLKGLSSASALSLSFSVINSKLTYLLQ